MANLGNQRRDPDFNFAKVGVEGSNPFARSRSSGHRRSERLPETLLRRAVFAVPLTMGDLPPGELRGNAPRLLIDSQFWAIPRKELRALRQSGEGSRGKGRAPASCANEFLQHHAVKQALPHGDHIAHDVGQGPTRPVLQCHR